MPEGTNINNASVTPLMQDTVFWDNARQYAWANHMNGPATYGFSTQPSTGYGPDPTDLVANASNNTRFAKGKSFAP